MKMLDLYRPTPEGTESATYRALAEHLKSLILGGRLSPGSKLPPVRSLARFLGISNLTVQRAYAELARSGFTKAATNKGTWVADEPSRAVVRQVVAAHLNQGPANNFEQLSHSAGLRSLTFAIPDPSLFDPSEILAELSELRLSSRWTWTYAPETGLPELVSSILKLTASSGMDSSGDQILVTMGMIHGLSVVVGALPTGPILAEDPSPTMIAKAVTERGREYIGFTRSERGINLDEIGKLARLHKPAALMITPLFHNPTGSNLPLDQMMGLIELSRACNFKIIELDPYRLISYEGAVSAPLATYGGEQVIYLSSLSYCLTPGFRLGYIRCESEFRNLLAREIRHTIVSTPALLQFGMAQFLSRGGLARHLGRVLPKYRARRDAMYTSLRQHLPEAAISYPQGGFSLWIELPPGDYSELPILALQRGIAVSLNMVVSQRLDMRRHLRLSFAALPTESIRECVRELAEIVHSLSSGRHGKSA